MENIKLETSKLIEIVHFVNASELDPIFLNIPYHLAPGGPSAAEGIKVLCQAMRYSKKIAIGRLVMGGHEHIAAITPRNKNLLFFTLRYAEEIYTVETYLQDMEDKAVDREQLVMAAQLMESQSMPFDAAKFKDGYY